MQYSPISLLRKSVRDDIVPSKRIKDLFAKPLRATRDRPAWIVARHRFGVPLKTTLTWVVPCTLGGQAYNFDCRGPAAFLQSLLETPINSV
jgi:hypothetical protein